MVEAVNHGQHEFQGFHNDGNTSVSLGRQADRPRVTREVASDHCDVVDDMIDMTG